MSNTMAEEKRVCPAEHAGMLDNGLRRLIHPGKKIAGPYVEAGDTVLDLGCGPGSFTDTLAELAGEEGRIIAVDLQQPMLKAMEDKLKKKNLQKRVVSHLCQSDSLQLEEYKDSADFALAFWMAHETPDIKVFLSEVYDALKQGGSLLCVEPKFHVDRELFEEMILIGEEIGYRAQSVKGILFSRSVLFTK